MPQRLARQLQEGVGDGTAYQGQAGLADALRCFQRGDRPDFDALRSVGHPQDGIVVEIGLADLAVPEGDALVQDVADALDGNGFLALRVDISFKERGAMHKIYCC